MQKATIIYFDETDKQKYNSATVDTLETLLSAGNFKSFIIKAGEIIGAER